MCTLKELNSRVDHFADLIPVNGQPLISELRKTIEMYLNRDEEFELQINKTLDKVVSSNFHHRLKYENQELLEPWQDESQYDVPPGFNNVRELFVLDDVFDEMAAVTDEEFVMAFFNVTINGSAQGPPELHNTYVDKWIAALLAGMENELAGLKTIMQSCANRGYAAEFALLFEELGKCINRREIKAFAKDIFYERGYGWLVETFNLKHVYRPSYMSELPDWAEDGDDGATESRGIKQED